MRELEEEELLLIFFRWCCRDEGVRSSDDVDDDDDDFPPDELGDPEGMSDDGPASPSLESQLLPRRMELERKLCDSLTAVGFPYTSLMVTSIADLASCPPGTYTMNG